MYEISKKTKDYCIIFSLYIYTGLPTKYETSETTVRNLKMCFLVSSQRFSPSINFFVCLLNDELTHKKTIFKAEDLICPIERVRE